MIENVLILTEAAEDDWAYVEWKKNDLNAAIIFKKVNKGLRAVRRIWMKYHLPFAHIWYGDWKKKAISSDMVIVHISYLTMGISSYLNKINPNARIIAWYWNRVIPNENPNKIRGKCEKWSFDPNNCSEYRLHFNHQYYFKSLICKSEEILWDLYFCGSDSGRGEAITRIYEICKKEGIRTKFQVVYPIYERIPQEIISSRVKYEEIRENIAKSKAILEIVREGQSGATIRLMEAMFFGKKLITNNSHVINEGFYDEKNIFVLGVRPMSDLALFLQEEIVPYPDELLNKYDVKQWVQNFVDGGRK